MAPPGLGSPGLQGAHVSEFFEQPEHWADSRHGLESAGGDNDVPGLELSATGASDPVEYGPCVVDGWLGRYEVEGGESVSRTPPGRFRVRWYDPDGKPKMRTFTRKVDADVERTRMEFRLHDGSYCDPAAARVKFADAAEPWPAAQIHLKRSTRARYRGVLDVHVIPKWGTTPLNFVDALADASGG